MSLHQQIIQQLNYFTPWNILLTILQNIVDDVEQLLYVLIRVCLVTEAAMIFLHLFDREDFHKGLD